MSQRLFSKPVDEMPVKPCAEAPASRGPAPWATARALRAGSTTARLPGSDADDQDSSLVFAEVVDRTINYAVSRLTLGLSPAAVAEALAQGISQVDALWALRCLVCHQWRQGRVLHRAFAA
jgi:hypothetical protein